MKINNAWQLIDQAAKFPEVEMNAPLGFMLGATSKEFDSHCDKLIKQNGGKKDNGIYIKTSVFGGVDRMVRINQSFYFSDPNTETDIIDEITFIFDEFRDDYSTSNKDIKFFLSQIDSMFDNTWQTADFQLELDPNKFDDYHKFWMKNNQVVEFEYDFYLPMLTFYNIPKSGTQWIKKMVNMSLEIKEDISNNDYSQPKVKISNSPWDGSVYQVKKYLKGNLKDPDSYEAIEWSSVVEQGSNFIVRHKYRAKNSFGGYVIDEYLFTLNSDGEIINAEKTN